MDLVQERAYAKLNLNLGVLYKRMDGYHALDTLMQSIDLYDTVTVEKDTQVTVTASGSLLPYNNTLRRAALAYMAYTGKGARIHVVKRIPMQSGLGGGSTDAAAVLRAMQQLYGDLDEKSLLDIALSVGADVPFCLTGGLARCRGIGEQIDRIAGIPMYFVIAKPETGVSTRELFYSLPLPRPEPNMTAALGAIANGDLAALGKLLFNALEEPAVNLVPEIAVLHERLIQAGALGASMSGSGSTVFGLFDSAKAAREAFGSVADASFARNCRAVRIMDPNFVAG